VTALLQLEGVVAGYGRGDILRGLDLSLEEGTITCLVGPNGAGKSTVLKTLSGLLRAREGRIVFDGEDICRLSPARVIERGIVHITQERGLFPLLTVWDNLLMGGYVVRDRALVRRRAEAAAARFPLVAERREERAGELSGGQQKVVEIARALMLEPRLILLDEPTMGLDPKARHQIFEMISGLNENGRTVLLVEQNARAGLAIADQGAVLDGGRVALTGAGRRLLDDPRIAELYLGGATAPARGAEARASQDSETSDLRVPPGSGRSKAT
jgi:branched-chain amino acid transport system ATP-binding protein